MMVIVERERTWPGGDRVQLTSLTQARSWSRIERCLKLAGTDLSFARKQGRRRRKGYICRYCKLGEAN